MKESLNTIFKLIASTKTKMVKSNILKGIARDMDGVQTPVFDLFRRGAVALEEEQIKYIDFIDRMFSVPPVEPV